MFLLGKVNYASATADISTCWLMMDDGMTYEGFVPLVYHIRNLQTV